MTSLSDSASSNSSSHSWKFYCTSSEISAQIYSPITPDASFEFDDDEEDITIGG